MREGMRFQGPTNPVCIVKMANSVGILSEIGLIFMLIWSLVFNWDDFHFSHALVETADCPLEAIKRCIPKYDRR